MSEFTPALKDEIKAELLNLGENVATDAVDSVFKIIELVIKDSKNMFDDMLLPVIPQLKKVVMEYVEDIDKADNE